MSFLIFRRYQNYRGLQITTNDLFLQILPILCHFLYSRAYVRFAEMNERVCNAETYCFNNATNRYRSSLVRPKSCVARVSCDIDEVARDS